MRWSPSSRDSLSPPSPRSSPPVPPGGPDLDGYPDSDTGPSGGPGSRWVSRSKGRFGFGNILGSYRGNWEYPKAYQGFDYPEFQRATTLRLPLARTQTDPRGGGQVSAQQINKIRKYVYQPNAIGISFWNKQPTQCTHRMRSLRVP